MGPIIKNKAFKKIYAMLNKENLFMEIQDYNLNKFYIPNFKNNQRICRTISNE